MSEPTPLRVIEAGALRIGVLPMPPPHMVFLASRVRAAGEADAFQTMRYSGGLAALVVRELNGESVVNERRLPRTLEELGDLGEGFIMAAYEAVGSYEGLTDMFHAVLAAYRGDAANPT